MSTLSILAGLSKEQRAVAKHVDGSLFVSATAGSGKTATLVARTQYMIERGVSPSHILLFTFTNKAANEIKDRIRNKIKDKTDLITMGTYHSVCLRILKKYIKYTLYHSNFSIFDDEDSFAIIKNVCKNSIYDPKDVQRFISSCKDNLIMPNDALLQSQQQGSTISYIQAQLYKRYNEELLKQNAMDFDDLILNTVILLQNFHEVKNEINDKYRYIISDETQDASVSNLLLLQLLNGHNNICMFLDDDQSIYSFRGADLLNLIMSKNKFPGLKTYTLTTNYRSTQTIVNAAAGVITNNSFRTPKTCVSNNDIGNKIYYCEFKNKRRRSEIRSQYNPIFACKTQFRI